MIALANHATIPFFDRVPVRAGFAIRRACDLIELPHQTADGIFAILCTDLKLICVGAPSRAEFNVWYEEIKQKYAEIPKAVFFDDVPTRVKDKVLVAFDNITARSGQSPREAYNFLINILKSDNVDGPTFDEYAVWRSRVKNGLIERPDPNNVRAAAREARAKYEENTTGQPPTVTCDVGTFADPSRLEHARAVVAAAHALFSAKIAAGYSPISTEIDDMIVQEALIELLGHDVSGCLLDTDMTPGHRLVELLLDAPDRNGEAEDKLVNCLTLYMQAELCALLVARTAAP